MADPGVDSSQAENWTSASFATLLEILSHNFLLVLFPTSAFGKIARMHEETFVLNYVPLSSTSVKRD